MTCKEFRQLTPAEQAEVINKYGSFLAQRIVASNRMYLYTISAFYIELLHVLHGPCKGISIFRVFEDAQYLDIYSRETETTVYLQEK